MFAKIWVQQDQGGGDRTCLQARRWVLPPSPDLRGRRRTRHRLNLAYERRVRYQRQTRLQAIKQTIHENNI